MGFIPPKYSCDVCGAEEEAEWTGEPHWDVPQTWKGWAEDVEGKHYCPNCVAMPLTKGAIVNQEHWEALHPDAKAFQILMGD